MLNNLNTNNQSSSTLSAVRSGLSSANRQANQKGSGGQIVYQQVSIDKVTLSAQSGGSGGGHTVLFASINHMEARVASVMAKGRERVSAKAAMMFEKAGRSEYLSKIEGKIEGAIELSAKATAGRILGGITGYIFGAFKIQNPKPTEAEFQAFYDAVSSGFEQGYGEAVDILKGLAMLDDNLADSIAETKALVTEGLQAFHDLQMEQIKERS